MQSPFPSPIHLYATLAWPSSLSSAEPGCSSTSAPVLTSSEYAGPIPAPGAEAVGAGGRSCLNLVSYNCRGDNCSLVPRWCRDVLLPDQVPETPDFVYNQCPHPVCRIFLFKAKVKGDFAEGLVGWVVPYRKAGVSSNTAVGSLWVLQGFLAFDTLGRIEREKLL